MRRRVWEYGLFLREFWRNFHTTGAILPSGRFLAAALARFVADGAADGTATGGRRILEVGPGTGAVTRRIIAHLGADDRLDLVELNDSFVEQLRHRFQSDEAFRPVAQRSRVLHCPVEELDQDDPYDLIISGLPLNNFSVDVVQRILSTMLRLLAPGGTLSFFEYIAVRRFRALVSGRAERARLRGIGRALQAVLEAHEIRRDRIWPNVPPAWVHHVRRHS